jgi:Mn-dependent DtxR family transcriptional regulator
MKQRSDEFYALITPELLFNLNKKYKRAYLAWVYIFIRLDYIKYIKDLPDQFFKINRKPICEFFDVHPATISRAFDELIEKGLMEEQNGKYKVPFKLDETFFNEIEGYPEYIMINNNFIIDFNQRLKSEYEKSGKKDRTPIKVMEIFHYLITKNHHIMVDTPILNSKETVESISISLNHDENCVKNYLEILQTMGYIEMDEEYNIINTVYGYGKWPAFKKNTKGNSYKASRIQNQETKEFELMNENIEIKPIPTDDEYNEVKKKEFKVNNSEEIKPEPITDFERIKLYEIMSNGNKDKLIALLENSNIDRNIGIEYFKNSRNQENPSI